MITLLERFMSNVAIGDGCWEWQASIGSHGYGQTTIGGVLKTSHRASWELMNGEIPEGKWVLHKCDNRKCVRLDHLFLGNQQDNMADAARKMRLGHGENHWNSKLTDQRVTEIYNLCKTGVTYMAASRLFSISHATIQDFCGGKSWKHLGLLPLTKRQSGVPPKGKVF